MKYAFNSLLILFFLLFNQSSFGQGSFLTTNKANLKIQISEFDKGIKLYHKVLSKDSTYLPANNQLAYVYSDILEVFDSACFYYERVFRLQKKDTNYYNYFAYANSLRMLNKQEKALKNYAIFKNNYKFKVKEEDVKLKEKLEKNIVYCKISTEKFNSQIDSITVKNVGSSINTDNNEYTSVFVKNNTAIVYNGRHKDFKDEYLYVDDQYFENMYCYQIDDKTAGICNLSENQSTHYAVVNAVDNSDSLILFFENKLWISKYDDYSITERKPLPTILSGYYYQPTGVFSQDQKTFIFSAKKTRFDDLNIYISHKNNVNEWSQPKKIDELNTKYDEDSPFLTNNGKTIYFSSKGHESSGDYDIYKSTFENEKWTQPINLNYPINSPGDDIFFELNTDGRGFLSSNRTGGFGLMDIYEVKYHSNTKNDDILVSNNNSEIDRDSIQKENTTVDDLTTNHITDITTNSTIIKDPYFEPIYFGFNQFNLTDESKVKLDKLLDYLETYKDVKIVITGHTDSKGSVAYNKVLANNRIKSTIKYLSYKNLDKSRILKTISIGEDNPAFPNEKDGLDNEDNRKKNRKTAFILYK